MIPANNRQQNDPTAAVMPIAWRTGMSELASTPNTRIVVMLHTSKPYSVLDRSTSFPAARLKKSA
jgi:hypothetical protein